MDRSNVEDLRQLVEICRQIEVEIRDVDRDTLLSDIDHIYSLLSLSYAQNRAVLDRLDKLREFVDQLTRFQLDFRIIRLRVEASLPEPEPPDSEKTPRRPVSVQDLRALKAGRPPDGTE